METIYTNCNIITRDSIIHGTVSVEDGIIRSIDDSSSFTNSADDLNNDFLLPGLVEMHTDNLEKNIQPRPGVIWPSIFAASIAHDSQLAGSGITTVFDAIAVGGLRESSLRSRIFDDSIQALSKGKEKNIFKADHFLHLRCEISDEHMGDMLMRNCENPHIRLLSLMDHTPGQRQWSDLTKWRTFHRDKKWTDQEADQIVHDRRRKQQLFGEKHRRLAVEYAQSKNIPIASHDDTTTDDISLATRDGITIAEFPTTLEAAEAAKHHTMMTIMGAPNAVRGGSHSGNISALTLAKKNLLDGFSSDYVPSSLLQAPFHLSDVLNIPLPQCIAMVSANIAETVGLTDRGELLPGKRADMVQVHLVDGFPVIKKVWKKGVQIA